jgi:exonuclease III
MVLLYLDKCTGTNKRIKMEEVKEELHNLLEQNINQTANSDSKIILGDFNAKVVKVGIHKPTIGNESLHIETNNEIQMIQFAISKGFNVRSIIFPHKDIHKETWYSANGRTANQIDHVLISNRFKSAITDIRGPDIVSDNNLLKINFK